MKYMLILLLLTSCGLQILEKGISGSFDNGAYNFSGSNVGNGIINNTSAIWQWDFNYQDENGETAHCLTQFAANSATPVYSAGVPENCRLYSLGGTLQNPIVTPSVFIHGTISNNACLQIKDSVTGEILFASTCVKVSGSMPQASCSSVKPAGLVYSELGSGTVSDPYQIFSGAQLISIASDTSALSKHFIQCDHIDLSGMAQFKIGDDVNSFTGSFNGAGYKIKNYSYVDTAATMVGLFGKASNVILKNIFLLNSKIDVDAIAGALAGLIVDGGTVSNIIASNVSIQGIGASTSDFGLVGGIVGVVEQGNYQDMRSTGLIQSIGGGVGGVFGVAGGSFSGTYGASIQNISSAAEIHAGNTAGGAVGAALGLTTIENSYATGNITTPINQESNAGGFVGNMDAIILRHCYATGNINGGSIIGGLIGRAVAGGEIYDSYATGNMNCQENTVNTCETGGFVARALGAIKIHRSFSLGNIMANNSSVGGFMGFVGDQTIDLEIQNSFSLGNVTVTGANQGIGGFIGNFDGPLKNHHIINSFAAGKIINAPDSSGVGGFIGNLTSNAIITIENSFAVNDTVTGLVGVGEFIGDDSGAGSIAVTNNFYYSGVICTAACNGNYATAKSSKNYFYSKANAPLNAWDFAAVWKEVAGNFPLLQ